MKPEDFINTIAPAAQHFQQRHGIFSSITMAQAILETGWGKFIPVDKYTGESSLNLFGLKGKGTAGSVRYDTIEFQDGKMVTVEAEFRAYRSWEESIEDHSIFLLSPKYSPVREASDYPEAARRLQSLGYATDPDYSTKLIRIIEEYRLDQYDIQSRPLPDVPAEHWAAQAVARLKQEGIISGYEDGMFHGDSPASRYEVAVIIDKLLKYLQN